MDAPTPDSAGRASERTQSASPWKRLAIRLVSIPLVAYALVVLSMMFLENSLIFFPSVYPEGDWKPAGLTFEDAWFQAADGTKLHGWYVPHEKPRAVVLFAHGNAGNLSDRAEIVARLVDRLAVSVMIFDYRGYGRSEGSPNEAGVYADARAARNWLAGRTGIEPNQLLLYGESIGGAVMVDLAAADGARGLVLENTFNSLADVASHHYRWLPTRLMRARFDSTAKIGRYHGPLLQIHGDFDRIVPIELARRLFEAANEPKTFVVMRGADHNDPRHAAFFRAFDEFLSTLPPL